MKIKSIGISHMHQIKDSVVYDLKDISYFVGPNGAGKSSGHSACTSWIHSGI